MKLWKKGLEILLLSAVVVGLSQSFAPAKMERTKVIKKDYDAKAEIEVNHEYGPLTIKKSSDGRTHLEAQLLVTGTDEASMEELMGRFDVVTTESGSSLRVTTKLDIERMNNTNDKATIKFCDGKKVKGINDFKVNMTLYVADPERMSLSNKYERIELVDEYRGDLRVVLYSGDLVANNLDGQFDLDLKYGKARLNNLGKARLVLYDSELKAANVKALKASSKYSKFVVGDVGGDLDLVTFDENWEVGNVGGKLTLNDKYSEFKFGNIGQAVMVVFDADFKMGDIKDLNIRDSKYSSYKINKVGKMELVAVFDDDYEVQEVKHLNAQNTKYSEYRIGNLGSHFALMQSFEDAVRLDKVSAEVGYIFMEAKYSKLDMDIAEGAQFEFLVDMQYGKVDFPERRVEIRKHEENNNRLSIVGRVGPVLSGSEVKTVKIRGFQNTVTWR